MLPAIEPVLQASTSNVGLQAAIKPRNTLTCMHTHITSLSPIPSVLWSSRRLACPVAAPEARLYQNALGGLAERGG